MGTYGFSVDIVGFGFAKIIPSTTFTFNLNANSILPTTVGTGGGVALQISGAGFSQSTTVSVDGNNCPITQFTYNSITCIVPNNVKFLLLLQVSQLSIQFY